ncbi:hypothetical protein HHK36_017098 [Tetracentron sinense]|uniref:Uncharacterized protein n=1 Tax=Tetracentron sinense TaxID=13715 RepID=A0A834Z1V4_TETSI|nr:hypothetical protein HHK36_017098 [Tetracentron sinense]
MERDLGSDSVPFSGSLDKSRVLNVRPLRSLVPVFQSQHGFTTFSPPQAPPFVCAPPSGPFPPGFSPFYPFSIAPDSQRPPEQHPHAPSGATNQAGVFGFNHPAQTSSTPLPSFRTPPSAAVPTQFAWPENGDTGPSSKSFRNSQTGKGESVRSAMEGDGFNNENQVLEAPYLSSFKMHIPDTEAASNGEKKHKAKPHKRVKYNKDTKLSLSTGGDTFMTFDTVQRADGDRESVGYILTTFDALRRRMAQIEDAKEASPGGIRRPDLKAGAILMNKGIRTNTTKRIGAVPGVEVGDIFFFRFEMCLVGLHAPSMAGIDYMILKTNQEEEPVALSIVSSGAYEDNADDGDVLIYSGQGGNINNNKKDKQIVDQKLERGNLALERSLRRANEVRVIRGMNVGNSTVKVYVYDGLYQIQESWIEQGKSGCNVFKYKLVRVPGQPDAFSVWKSVQQWKEGSTSRIGVILPDLTSGAETLPVSLVNDVDEERGPAYFTYFPTLKYLKPVNSLTSSFGCNCHGSCPPGDPNCSCNRRNGGDLPYTGTGVLVVQKSLVHECGPSCSCNSNCRNRVSQTGLKVRLEVFKTKDKGWGLRTLDPIRAGAFICEYAGEVIEKVKGDDDRDQDEDEYIFDATRTYENSLQWNYIPGLLGEEMPSGLNEAYNASLPLTISAKNSGNVARFMNHSCSPSVFWQPVLHANNNESNLHIAFYATKHIPPITELTYDYGIIQSEKQAQSNNAHRRKICLCGSSKCRGYFG